MATPTDRVIPPAGSTRQPWPWQLPAAVVVLLVALFAARVVFPPALAITAPTLSFHGEVCTVAFRVTNNTDRAASASLLVIESVGGPGSKRNGPRYADIASKSLSVTLISKETEDLTCDFPRVTTSYPNTARVEVVSYNQ